MRSPVVLGDKVVDFNRVRLWTELDDILHKEVSTSNFAREGREKIGIDLLGVITLVLGKVDEPPGLTFIQKSLISELHVVFAILGALHPVDIREPFWYCEQRKFEIGYLESQTKKKERKKMH